MLRRVENVTLQFVPSVFTGKARPIVVVGQKSYRLAAKIHKDEWARVRLQQQVFPVQVLSLGERMLWQFQDRFYWDNDGLRADEVHALLVTRQQRERQRIDRAQAMVVMGEQPRQRERGVIPDDMKQLVWRRDGGRCRQCGSTTELQYDHIIPVAMGGATSAENLQILCGPCNRRKGAGLIVSPSRGGAGNLQQPEQRGLNRTEGRSADMSPPAPWQPRSGWGTIRDYELRRNDQDVRRISCTFVPDDGSEPIIVDTTASDELLAEMGEYARGVMPDRQHLTIKVSPDGLRRAEDLFREINDNPLAQRVAIYGDGSDDIYGDCGWAWTREYRLEKVAPGLLIQR